MSTDKNRGNIQNPKEQELTDLVNGKKPVTDKEKQLAKEIEDIKRRGNVVEIPSDI